MDANQTEVKTQPEDRVHPFFTSNLAFLTFQHLVYLPRVSLHNQLEDMLPLEQHGSPETASTLQAAGFGQIVSGPWYSHL